MDASRHVGIWTGVKVFLLLHIFQSPNYRAHIFIQPNKTNEISSHVLRSTKCFILSSLLKQQHKALAFQLKPSGAITKVPKCIFALQLVPVCPQLPGLGWIRLPYFCHRGKGVRDTHPSHWSKLVCTLSLPQESCSQTQPTGINVIVHTWASPEYLFSSPWSASWAAALRCGIFSSFCSWGRGWLIIGDQHLEKVTLRPYQNNEI